MSNEFIEIGPSLPSGNVVWRSRIEDSTTRLAAIKQQYSNILGKSQVDSTTALGRLKQIAVVGSSLDHLGMQVVSGRPLLLVIRISSQQPRHEARAICCCLIDSQPNRNGS